MKRTLTALLSATALISVMGSAPARAALLPRVDFTTVGAATYTVPAGVSTLHLEVAGGGGGGGYAARGGNGGIVSADIEVTEGQVISIFVGGGGGGGQVGQGGGGGGGASSVNAGLASQVIAGGGGGGGGGSQNVGGNGNGGNGADVTYGGFGGGGGIGGLAGGVCQVNVRSNYGTPGGSGNGGSGGAGGLATGGAGGLGSGTGTGGSQGVSGNQCSPSLAARGGSAGGGGGGYGGGGSGFSEVPDGGGGGGGSTGPIGRTFSVGTNSGAVRAAGASGYVYITPDDTPRPVADYSQLPPDVFQSVGLPPSGGCSAVDDSALNWGGSTTGGWTPSWAQWMNDGHGGAVCNRILGYDPNLEHWITR